MQDEDSVNLDLNVDDQELESNIIEVFFFDACAAFDFVEIVRICSWFKDENIRSDCVFFVSKGFWENQVLIWFENILFKILFSEGFDFIALLHNIDIKNRWGLLSMRSCLSAHRWRGASRNKRKSDLVSEVLLFIGILYQEGN